jgi:hypothetical protein
MDPHIDAAQLAMRRHRPHPLWKFFGIKRCRSCGRRWPCGSWHHARDIRDRVLDIAAIARMTDIARQTYGVQPPNGGRWS